MTKWARMRRRKERRRAQEEPERSHNDGKEMGLTQPEQVSKTTNHPQETKKFENLETSKSGTIITQIPRYVYLTALFVLFSGVFFPTNNTRNTVRPCYSRHCDIISGSSRSYSIIQSYDTRKKASQFFNYRICVNCYFININLLHKRDGLF